MAVDGFSDMHEDDPEQDTPGATGQVSNAGACITGVWLQPWALAVHAAGQVFAGLCGVTGPGGDEALRSPRPPSVPPWGCCAGAAP